MLTVLVIMTIAALAFTDLVGFKMYGGDYNAACMCAGLIGVGMGSGSNAVANEKAVMDQYGYSHIAWILYLAPTVSDRRDGLRGGDISVRLRQLSAPSAALFPAACG